MVTIHPSSSLGSWIQWRADQIGQIARSSNLQNELPRWKSECSVAVGTQQVSLSLFLSRVCSRSTFVSAVDFDLSIAKFPRGYSSTDDATIVDDVLVFLLGKNLFILVVLFAPAFKIWKDSNRVLFTRHFCSLTRKISTFFPRKDQFCINRKESFQVLY